MLDAVILSDIHLGSDNCQAKNVVRLLEQVADGELATARVILNGDVFDSIDFRRLNKHHWKVLSLIRKLSNHVEITWLYGNHDDTAEIFSHMLGVTVMNEFILESGSRRILILHGHRFDNFLDKHPIITWLADCVYCFLQWVDRTHYFAKLAKRGSKTFLRCAKKIEVCSIDHARRRGCDAV
jgi:UDP-2,3-diacylglucosamine pyrophosphatase LpxH